jgi:5'-3' exonuclease
VTIHLLFDGDILAYRAGFAAEKRVYFDKRLPHNGGELFDYKKEALRHIPEEFLAWERELQPLGHALENCKNLIKKSIKFLSQHYSADVTYVCFLTGNDKKHNFRAAVDPNYKKNRDPVNKPTYLQEIKDYILLHHNGYTTQGCEADDFFGHAQSDAIKNGTLPIIVGVDKDLKQLAGMHFNVSTQELEHISQAHADSVFWRQMLEGDRADNITGVSGIGKIKAERYVPLGTPFEEAKEKVIEFYKTEFKEGWEEKFNNNCDLLWIWRKIPDQCPFKLQRKEENKKVGSDSPIQISV